MTFEELWNKQTKGGGFPFVARAREGAEILVHRLGEQEFCWERTDGSDSFLGSIYVRETRLWYGGNDWCLVDEFTDEGTHAQGTCVCDFKGMNCWAGCTCGAFARESKAA